MMTIPREIKLEKDGLRQIPLEELKSLRRESFSLMDRMELPSSSFEIEGRTDIDFEISIYNDAGESLLFSGNSLEYCLNRENTSHPFNEKYGSKRFAKRNPDAEQHVRIFVDRSSIEIFAENGLVVYTSRFYLERMNLIRIKGVDGKLYRMGALNINKC